ncbi:glycosyltransferase family 4 protein [Saccharicrinis fermentans]|uniref:D-inositol-3-phosphate glycosyltransferase n=1 Tax=Saccharicrinis fermentans DSM 9555 = JCM 21142 TaxID=869213 RepID=W7YBB6_9BACT|nr:glycosyltransferase family 1 protein [Saccharicrinis fermentans]GAF04923.1 D-inositol-3-phosphate glycosyltransferase [Saccharicrinis fermentans DSM 9555 = JCM 21142]
MNKTKVTYYFRKPQPQYFSIEKVFEQVIAHMPKDIEPVIYKLKNGTNGWWGRLKALWEVWRNRGGINHITGDITFVALALPKKGLVVTFHDMESLAQYKGWRFMILKYLWVNIPVRRAQEVTVISEHTKKQLLQWTGCNSNKITVIHNPLPENINYCPKNLNVLCPTILVMGTKANKNVEGIFKAVYLLKKQWLEKKRTELGTKYLPVGIKLLVVGDLNPEQKALSKQYKLDVDNLVQVPYEQIMHAYQSCDLLCFPSFYEGFGLPIIEAQAIGRPVITSDFGAMKEIAGAGALLVDPHDCHQIAAAIEALLHNPTQRNKVIAEGLRNIQQFKVNHISSLYKQLYEFS